MLELHIVSAVTTFALIVATTASLFARNIAMKKKLYWLFLLSTPITIGSGSVLSLMTAQPFAVYCTNMGAYVSLTVVSLVLFHYQIYKKQISFLPLVAQIAPFGVTLILLSTEFFF